VVARLAFVPLRRTLLLLVTVAGIAFWGWRFHNQPKLLSQCTTDFAAFYGGARLAGTPLTYSPEAVFAAQERAIGCHADYLVFIKPPFYAMLLWPLAQLPFETAIAIWRVLILLAFAVFVWLWPGNRLAHAAGCVWFLPAATSYNVGQDVAFVLAFTAIACVLARAGRPFLSGLLFGLCAIKFHLLVLLPLWIVHRRLWRVALGGAAVGVVFLALCFAGYGMAWPRLYWTALQDPRTHPYPWNLANLAGLFRSEWWIPCAVPVVFLCWYLIQTGKLELALAAALAGGTLLVPHNTVSDGVLFLPLLFWSRQSPLSWVRATATFTLTPFYRFLPPGTLQVLILVLLVAAAYQLRRRTAAGWNEAMLSSAPAPAGPAE